MFVKNFKIYKASVLNYLAIFEVMAILHLKTKVRKKNRYLPNPPMALLHAQN